ncbi:hypothetical protein Sste5346_005825 [Sporothrix stenoceras]|uniref:Uncharacterized protein n=1 Tax=Sporothrix stenoceras TaxID=5173 RepID=A0ABR3Z2U3_9PEZI
MRGKRKSNRSNAGSGSGSGSGNASPSGHPNRNSEPATHASRAVSWTASPLKRSRASSPEASDSGPARRARTKKPVPFDQRFPFEVIERIFFFSMNFNLPRASPRFGWMLSSRHTLRDLIFAAFGPQWELTLTEKRYKRPTTKKKAKLIRAHASVNDFDLQTAVLDTPWMKMDLMVETMQIWLQGHKDKRYLHVPVPVPFVEAPDHDTASRFVLNIDDFDTLNELHPSEHHLIPNILSDGHHDSENYESFGGLSNQNHNASTVDRGSGWPSDGLEDEEEDDDDTVEWPEEDDFENNDGNGDGYGGYEQVDNSGPRVSAHICFAMDQYSFLGNMYQIGQFEPQPLETPSELLDTYIGDRTRGVPGPRMDMFSFIFMRMGVGALFPHGPSLWRTQIPEWLQLAGGPYPAARNQTREGRKALRDRLRETFDMLSWIVFAGGKLQQKDSWELTWQGFQSLLEVDVTPSEWDSYEDGEEVIKSCHHVSVGLEEKTIRLQYSVDTLVSGILGLFYSLGVFYYQMPQHILKSAMEMATQRGVSGGESYRQTQTYLTLQRIAFLMPANNKKSILDSMPEAFGLKF